MKEIINNKIDKLITKDFIYKLMGEKMNRDNQLI